MKRFGLTVLMLFAFATIASAAVTGSDLYPRWKAYQAYDLSAKDLPLVMDYMFYVSGVLDGEEVMNAERYISKHADDGKICYPAGVTNLQTYLVVGKYLEDHPKDLHKSAALLVLLAVREAFPCGKEN